MRGQRRHLRKDRRLRRIIPARAGPTNRCPPAMSARTDHPRSCGANDIVVFFTKPRHGSSPLVRGQRLQKFRAQRARRIIPARAGPTRLHGGVFVGSADHPRSCGANSTAKRLPITLTWIIPARAGPTNCNIEINAFLTDHPRSCGANCLSAINAIEHSGSSPLVRGQLPAAAGLCELVRIIPARAGPTFAADSFREIAPDHPRSCGANLSGDGSDTIGDGSSPLVRGQLDHDGPILATLRIIPARAGPTMPCVRRVFEVADHPRSCGANVAHRVSGCRNRGSSPLVRGQPCTAPTPTPNIRIIPARAGPTERYASFAGTATDHPRSCGANLLFPSDRSTDIGSSPLVRGQLGCVVIMSACIRIIPARAGPTV